MSSNKIIKNIIDKNNVYATIKRGTVKVPIDSQQFKFLMAKKLPLTIVKLNGPKKTYERLNVKR